MRNQKSRDVNARSARVHLLRVPVVNDKKNLQKKLMCQFVISRTVFFYKDTVRSGEAIFYKNKLFERM